METSRKEGTSTLVRRIAVTGILVSITVLLGVLRIGFIPFPTGVNATILHIPVIIGAILEGWPVGLLIGLCFGLFSFLQATSPLFKDPLVAILPRMVIGVTAYFAYRGLRRVNELFAVGVGAAVGTATNTVLVLGVAVLRGYMDASLAATVAVTHGIPEVIVAVIITVAVVAAWKQIARRSGGSSV
jgi:uncharacterized membrane protein